MVHQQVLIENHFARCKDQAQRENTYAALEKYYQGRGEREGAADVLSFLEEHKRAFLRKSS